MACESVLPYLRDWLMPPAAVPARYARRVHIAFDYRAYRARCGRPTVRHADAQRCGVVRDGRGPIDLCARMLYRAVHMGRHTS